MQPVSLIVLHSYDWFIEQYAIQIQKLIWYIARLKFEPETLLLWGASVNHYSILPP